MSAFGGKADMLFCTANVCFDPKRTSLNRRVNRKNTVADYSDFARDFPVSRPCCKA
jgi:hypothetical protein